MITMLNAIHLGELMGQHYSLSIHFGSGDVGKARIETLDKLIKLKNFRSKAEAVQYCIDQVYEYEKQEMGKEGSK